MSEYKSKIWLSVGVCTMLGTMDLSQASASSKVTPDAKVQVSGMVEGGEGGESGAEEVLEGDALIYMAGLYEMEGAMRAGKDLYKAGDQKAALAQFNHLITLFNADVGHRIEELGFEREHVLVDVEQLPVSVEDNEAFEDFLHTYDHALNELDVHALNVEAVQRRDPAFVAELTVVLLQKISKFYASKDSVKQAHAAGLALTLRDLIGWTASEMRNKDKAGFAVLVANIDMLCDLLPVTGPFKADPSKVYGLGAQVEFSLNKVK